MACYTASRVNKFLDLPVTVITDESSISGSDYVFDRVITREPDRSNTKNRSTWINKGRYQVYELTPYDETLLLDTDYMINSQQLLETFTYSTDFVCHRACSWLLQETSTEYFKPNGLQSLWATVVAFQKTSRVEQIFQMIEQIQRNYQHYSQVYGFLPYTYRNDYALTVALKTVNGHLARKQDHLLWNLLNVSNDVKLYRETDTTYTAVLRTFDNKQSYIKISDTDFHMVNKENFLELMS
jgi:hypothetical protein